MTTTPPDWYPDPTGRHERRYWNGLVWTEHVWTTGVQGLDDLTPPTPDADPVEENASMAHDSSQVLQTTTKDAASSVKNVSRRQAKRQGRDEFESVALAAAHGDLSALAELPAAIDHAAKLYRGKNLEEKKWELLALGIRDVLDDDRLSEEEEQQLVGLSAALGLKLPELAARDVAAYEELVIAGLNDGRLPTADVPIVLQPGEKGRAMFPASLMKEVAIRETQRSSSGVRIRIAKGMTFRTGQMRARSVVVGMEERVQDVGSLVVTNRRAVFVGRARTLEFRFDRLVDIEQFKNGLRLSVSNRQLASLFRITPPASPLIAAAVISHSVE